MRNPVQSLAAATMLNASATRWLFLPAMLFFLVLAFISHPLWALPAAGMGWGFYLNSRIARGNRQQSPPSTRRAP